MTSFRGPHAASHVWIEGGIVGFYDETSWWSGSIEVELASLNCQVFAWNWRGIGDGFEDQGFVLDHGCDCLLMMCCMSE